MGGADRRRRRGDDEINVGGDKFSRQRNGTLALTVEVLTVDGLNNDVSAFTPPQLAQGLAEGRSQADVRAAKVSDSTHTFGSLRHDASGRA
jgi:hypothetical protein